MRLLLALFILAGCQSGQKSYTPSRPDPKGDTMAGTFPVLATDGTLFYVRNSQGVTSDIYSSNESGLRRITFQNSKIADLQITPRQLRYVSSYHTQTRYPEALFGPQLKTSPLGLKFQRFDYVSSELDGTKRTRHTTKFPFITQLDVSEDGKSLAYATLEDERVQIVRETVGKKSFQVFDSPDGDLYSPQWFDEGLAWVHYSRLKDQSAIVLLKDGKQTPVHSTQGFISNLLWHKQVGFVFRLHTNKHTKYHVARFPDCIKEAGIPKDAQTPSLSNDGGTLTYSQEGKIHKVPMNVSCEPPQAVGGSS